MPESNFNDAKALSFQNVGKKYGKFVAISDVTLEVGKTEFVTMLGPSGSGKTTLLSMAAGATFPESGKLNLFGRDVTHEPPHKRNIGMVFQRYTLFPNRTVRQNIAFPLEIRKENHRALNKAVDEMLDLVNMTPHAEKYPSEISGGQAQRVALARALVFKPSLLLMDEPLAALDRALRDTLQEEIKQIQRSVGVPILYVTHDQEEAMNISDRIIVLKDGKVVADAAPDIVYNEPPSVWVARFLGDANSFAVSLVEKNGSMGVVRDERGKQYLVRLLEGVSPSGAGYLVVRPENISIIENPGPGDIRVKLDSMTYVGARRKVRVQTESGSKLVISTHGRTTLPPVGGELGLSWAPTDALFLPEVN